VEQFFTASEIVGPAPGFRRRWQGHLLASEWKRDRRQAWLAAGGSVSVALLLFLAIGFLSWDQISNPVQIAINAVERFNLFLSQLRLTQDLLRIVHSALNDIHYAWWLLLGASYGGLGVVWTYFMYRLTVKKTI
jgi:hypothetical protein